MMRRCCPVSPLQSPEEEMVCPPCEEWESPDAAGIALDKGVVEHDDGNEEVAADTGEVVQVPLPLPSPKLPSQSEIDFHNLCHVPYRSWCPFCVAARRKNSAHRSQHGEERTIPLICSDYCFLNEEVGGEAITVLVTRMMPSRAIGAIPCDQKGHDEYTVHRLRSFLKSEGISKLVYKSDQEKSLRRLLGDVIAAAQQAGDVLSAVPESSAIGESQSNGRAENAVQQFEDQIRTLKAALEARLSSKVPVTHPVFLWLIEHTASILNRYFVAEHGKTPYEFTHGKRHKGRTAEFGEKVLYYVPKKLRSKMNLRWRVGVFLGTAPSSNEAFIGLSTGNVVKSRSIVRVVNESRWNSGLVLGITGTPMKPNPSSDGQQDAEWVEESAKPHEHVELDVEMQAKPSEGAEKAK